MYEQNAEDKQLKLIQKYIPDATAEKLQKYQRCMREEATLNCAVPVGLLFAAGTYLSLPKKVATPRKLLTGFAGITGYICGKLFYSPICSKKAFGLNLTNKREQVPYTSDNANIYDQEDQEKKYLMYPDKMEEESSWSNYNSSFENYSSDFDYTNDTQEVQEEKQLPSKQHRNERKRVTYDDLWRQHNEEKMTATYENLSRERNRPAANERRRVSEESPVFEAEDNEKNIWS